MRSSKGGVTACSINLGATLFPCNAIAQATVEIDKDLIMNIMQIVHFLSHLMLHQRNCALI